MITRKPKPPYVVVLGNPRRTRNTDAKYGLVPSVAAKSKYSEARVRALLRGGKIDGMKVGSVWLANRTALRAYEKRRNVT